jgi:plasmid stability protein
MSTLTIRDLKPAVVNRLKRKAAANHRSLEGEVRALLEREAAEPTMKEWLAEVAKLRSRQRPRRPDEPTGVDLVRQSRDEDR